MKQCFSNATVMWDESDIIQRENLVKEISHLLYTTFNDLNHAVRFKRVETPILTPESYLQSHIDVGFELINAGKRGYLRPETTAGTYEAFNIITKDKTLKKELPLCIWQVGSSFRDEKYADAMRASKLRLVQFNQLEFQLFCSDNTKAPYLETALDVLIDRYGGECVVADDLPHYSNHTLDWHIDGLEVAGCSERLDWEHGKVYEIAIGIDRLVALLQNKK